METALSNSLQEQLVTEYVKNHPTVKRDEVIKKCVNGQVVLDSIQNAFRESQVKKNIQDAQRDSNKKYMEFLEEYILIDENDRYTNCLASVKYSQKIIDLLFLTNNKEFKLQDKQENLLFLKRKERQCARDVVDIIKYKKELVQQMNSTSTKRSAVTVLVHQYMQSLLSQLKCQLAIYNRETDLGGNFSGYVRKLSNLYLSMGGNFIPDSSTAMIQKVISIIERGNQNKLDINKIPKGTLNQKLEEYEINLKQNRERLETFKKIVEVIEPLVERLCQIAEQQNDSSSPNENKSSTETNKRMAFTTKLFSKWKSRLFLLG